MNVHVYLFPDQNLVIQLECVMKAFESVFPIDTHTHTLLDSFWKEFKNVHIFTRAFIHTHILTLLIQTERVKSMWLYFTVIA